jgi:hypothetical protein
MHNETDSPKPVSLTTLKAVDHAGYLIPVATITISIPSPENVTLEQQRALYEAEAIKINEVLHSSLPQGLYHHLLIEMLKTRVDLYRGPGKTKEPCKT